MDVSTATPRLGVATPSPLGWSHATPDHLWRGSWATRGGGWPSSHPQWWIQDTPEEARVTRSRPMGWGWLVGHPFSFSFSFFLFFFN